MKILIADDDPQILRALRIILGAKGYRVITAANGAEAVSAAVDEQPDMFLLDLGMPQLDGIEVIQGIRGWSQAPILVVSGRTGAADKVQALDTGADDYITKPFAIDELLARIRALTRRIPQEKTVAVARLGDVTVDLATHSVTRTVEGGVKQIRLTPTEWQVMEVLLRNAGKLVTRQTLLTHVWGTEHVQDSGYLRLYISQLRKKLEADPGNPRHILTEQGMGYRLVGAEV
ncbi:response regulator transcription factor [Kocuria sp. KSNUG]|uniref:response regulator n=1 Tax=Kocuria sp. KSNUG TaxID=3136676 RepID=UPI003C2D113A